MSQEPTNSNSASDSNDLRDRLVDRALAERLGGDAPPDLTARILAAAEPSSLAHSHGDTSMDTQSSSRRSSVRTWVLAASLLVNCGLVATLLIAWDKVRQTAMNQQQNNLGTIQGAFDRQDPIANREFETAARPESSPVDGEDLIPPPTIDVESNLELLQSTIATDSWHDARMQDITGSAAPADGRINVNAHGSLGGVTSRTQSQNRSITTNGYEIAPSTGATPSSNANKPSYAGLVPPAPADRSNYESFYQVELSSIPQSNEPPIVYPSAEVWEELARRREKYKKVDLGGQDGMSSLATLDGKEPSDGSDDAQAVRRYADAGSQQAAQSGEIVDAFDPVDFGAARQNLDIPHRSTSFALEPMYSKLEDARGRVFWGYSGGDFREWELGYQLAVPRRFASNFGEQAAQRGRWQSSVQNELAKMVEGEVSQHPEVKKLRSEHNDIMKALRLALNSSNGESTPASKLLQKQMADREAKLTTLTEQLRAEWLGSPDGQGIGPDASGDQYDLIVENDFIPAFGGEAVSTFSIDVDTASYANVRQMLRNSQVPPADAVRLEEFVNYFDYEYEPPKSDEEAPFAAHVETAACPWQPAHRLVRIGIKGREVAAEKRPLSNLVFLVDVSGSMNEADKLPLVVHGLKKLTEQLGENDRVAIVVYASSEGLVLPSTPGTEKETILAALDSLAAGGSTAGGAGIQLAYQIAEDNFIEGGTNRVILCTDGDFNVGTTSTAELERMVEQKAKDTKVFLSCIGFGRGNLNDAMMENITGIGNGNYYYADGEQESERIFVKGMTGMLVTIAKDVKIQVEFNPAKVAGYRLLGYENRMLATQDFNDDKKDAGEIGAGHTVTCLYEIVPTGEEVEAAEIDELKYQRPAGLTDEADTDELLTLKMRYKKPDGDTSTKLEWPVADSGHKFGEASTDMQFAAAVASFGMLLRDSQYKGDTNYDAVIEIAESAKGKDPEGERAEFVELVRAAKKLKPVVTEEKEEAAAEQK